MSVLSYRHVHETLCLNALRHKTPILVSAKAKCTIPRSERLDLGHDWLARCPRGRVTEMTNWHFAILKTPPGWGGCYSFQTRFDPPDLKSSGTASLKKRSSILFSSSPQRNLTIIISVQSPPLTSIQEICLVVQTPYTLIIPYFPKKS